MKLLQKSLVSMLILQTFFLPKLALELCKHIDIKNYIIELINDQQFSYSHIYSLVLIELKTLKVYIKTT